MNILFVCKYNRFRSKVAEALFKKHNKNPGNKVKSAGIIRGSPISREIKKAVKDYGLKINMRPRGLSSKLLQWHDLMIIAADDVPNIFKNNPEYGRGIEVWKIRDTTDESQSKMKKILAQIEEKVKKLVKRLHKR